MKNELSIAEFKSIKNGGRFLQKKGDKLIPVPTIQELNTIEFLPKRNQVCVKVKPLTVNQCWQGKRFKTPEYKSYEKHLLLLLPKIVIPPGKLKLIAEFGASYLGSDIDNFLKPAIDIMQKKYWFNDSNIWELEVKKFKVEKGEEYIKFEFISINNK